MRVFVGGLSSDISPEALKKRFSSFAEASRVDIVRKPTRVFAYLEMDMDEKVLTRMAKTYTGTQWMGQTLRIEQAQPSMLDKYKRERELVEDAEEAARREKYFKYEDAALRKQVYRIPEPDPQVVLSKDQSLVDEDNYKSHKFWKKSKQGGHLLRTMRVWVPAEAAVRVIDPSNMHRHQTRFEDRLKSQNDRSTSRLEQSPKKELTDIFKKPDVPKHRSILDDIKPETADATIFNPFSFGPAASSFGQRPTLDEPITEKMMSESESEKDSVVEEARVEMQQEEAKQEPAFRRKIDLYALARQNDLDTRDDSKSVDSDQEYQDVRGNSDAITQELKQERDVSMSVFASMFGLDQKPAVAEEGKAEPSQEQPSQQPQVMSHLIWNRPERYVPPIKMEEKSTFSNAPVPEMNPSKQQSYAVNTDLKSLFFGSSSTANAPAADGEGSFELFSAPIEPVSNQEGDMFVGFSNNAPTSFEFDFLSTPTEQATSSNAAEDSALKRMARQREGLRFFFPNMCLNSPRSCLFEVDAAKLFTRPTRHIKTVAGTAEGATDIQEPESVEDEIRKEWEEHKAAFTDDWKFRRKYALKLRRKVVKS